MTKSPRFNNSDKKFIESTVENLLSNEIIKPSSSPWRSQVLVPSEGNHKRRMVIDYSQTINRFTLLNAYPLPCIYDIANDLTKYKIFSAFDLKSAYHQIPIKEEDQKYTAFEANGNLYNFVECHLD